jgi:hypothetical protein
MNKGTRLESWTVTPLYALSSRLVDENRSLGKPEKAELERWSNLRKRKSEDLQERAKGMRPQGACGLITHRKTAVVISIPQPVFN